MDGQGKGQEAAAKDVHFVTIVQFWLQEHAGSQPCQRRLGQLGGSGDFTLAFLLCASHSLEYVRPRESSCYFKFPEPS